MGDLANLRFSSLQVDTTAMVVATLVRDMDPKTQAMALLDRTVGDMVEVLQVDHTAVSFF